MVNTDEDVLQVLQRLLDHYENGNLDKRTYESAISLAMQRIRAEITMIRSEYDTISSTMPVPLQVAQKIEYNDSISSRLMPIDIKNVVIGIFFFLSIRQ